MDRPLNQEEIDALVKAARTRNAAAAEGRSRVQIYSFARTGQINEEQMRAISLLNDMFARNLAHNLSVWLRSPFQVHLVSAEQMPFSEFSLRIPDLAYVSSVRLEPLGALSVLQLDLSLAPTMIDLLLGGEGRRTREVRELTDIEESILAGVVESICRELSAAWQPVGLSFQFERRQMQTQVARIMPVTEKTLCLSFEITMATGVSGILNLAFPAVVSNTILRRLTGDWSREHRRSSDTRFYIMERASQLRFAAALQLPAVRVKARDLKNLQPGAIVTLAVPSNADAEFRVAGHTLYTGRPVSLGEHRGAHLTRSYVEEI